MIRPFTLVTMTAAAAAGLYLYQVKHTVSQFDRELRDINRRIEEVRERTQVLRAEWALLNEPERLRRVAQPLLALEPMAPTQFVRMEEMQRRLPPPRDFAGQPSLFAPPPPEIRPEGTVALAAVEPAAPPPRAAGRAAAAEPVPPRATAEAPRRPAAEAPRRPAAEPPVVAAAPRPPLRQALHVSHPGTAPPPSASILTGSGFALAPPVPVARAATFGSGQ